MTDTRSRTPFDLHAIALRQEAILADFEALIAEVQRLRGETARADSLAGAYRQQQEDNATLCAEFERVRRWRVLDNDDLARAYDQGRELERAAVVAWLRMWGGPLAEAAYDIERGEHRTEGA